MSKVSDLAREANSFLRRDTARDIVLPADGAPEWVTDLCRAGHANGAVLPDDWRYEFIQDALNMLEEDEDAEDGPDLDSAYPYTADRLRWFASSLDRPAYCDQVVEDLGNPQTEILAFVALGMQEELHEVFGQVRAFLAELAEARAAEAIEPGE